MSSFAEFISTHTHRVNNALKDRFNQNTNDSHQKLSEAMRYSLFNGGKRIRPLLIYASAYAFNEPNTLTDAAAAAIECIHTYSLIHDDLPAMDDDELRRGKPTCHIAFDEATAILAGDALQALAFEWLSQPYLNSDPVKQLKMCQVLATASGAQGMVSGQSIDLAAVGNSLSLEALTHMHRLKTGALISASTQLGALSTGVNDEKHLDALYHYSNAIGLAFQIQDDILDVTADTATLGKQQGADIANNKPTFVSLLGLETAKKQAQQLYDEALDALGCFDYRADYLRNLAAYIIQRKY